MNLPLLIEKVSGKPDSDFGCGVFNRKLTLPGGGQGELAFCGIAQGHGEGILREVFDLFAQRLEEVEGGSLNVLGDTEKKAGEVILERGAGISFVLAFFRDEACYLIRRGEDVKAVLFEPPNSFALDIKSGSGRIRPDQLYLLATSAFCEYFDTSAFKDSLDIDFADVIDGLATDISAAGEQSKMGAVFVHVGEGEEEGESSSFAEAAEDEQSQRGESEESKESNESEESNEVEQLEVPTVGEADGQERESVSEQEEFSGIVGGSGEELEGGGQLQNDRASKKNLIARLLGFVVSEAVKLKRGDLGAISRLRRNILVLAIVLVLIAVGSGGYAFWQKGQNSREQEFTAHFSAAKTKFNEGSAVIDLNKARAREILIEAEKEAKKASEIKEDSSLDSLLSQISEKLKQTEAVSNVKFTEVFKGANFNSISFSGSNLAVSSKDKIFEVNTSNGELVNESELGDSVGRSSAFDSKGFLLGNGEVLWMPLAGGEAKKTKSGSQALDIEVFFGNIYLLYKNKIGKIVPIESGYSQEGDYLTGEANFGEGARFTIDGSIWVAGGKEIFKFTRGEKESFAIEGLSGEVQFGPIYTSGNIDNLYVVDKTNSALLVIGKDGVYKKAFSAGEFGRAEDLAVKDDESMFYLLTGDKVLSGEIGE